MTHADLDDMDFSTLPLALRAELAQRLWDSVHADACAAPFTPEQLIEIDRRIAALDAGEMTCEPWEILHERLLGEL